MKVTWLGQASLLFEAPGCRILIDPYFSDSVRAINPLGYRRIPMEERFFALQPDVIVCTHNHLDHYDEETLDHFLKGTTGVTVITPPSCYSRALGYGRGHNYLYFQPGTEWTEKGVRFTGIKAFHSDPEAIGILLDDGAKKYYVTGDTLYNEAIFERLPKDIDTLFLPTNGAGNNMNIPDAQRFAQRVGAMHTVPLHRGMLDDLTFAGFDFPGAVIPDIFKEIKL